MVKNPIDYMTAAGLLALLAGSAALLSQTATPAPVSARARALHFNSLVFDGHIHAIDREFYNGGDLGQRLPDGQFDLPRAREGGLGAFFLSIYVTDEYYARRFETKQALRMFDFAIRQVERNHDTVELARTAADIERIHGSGKIAAVLDIEGSYDLDGDPAVIRQMYRLGVRSTQLSAHNYANNYADSCCSPPKWHGLNERGREVIREMNRLGMVINVSHASDDAISQAIDLSTVPLVATHHGLRSITNIPRTMPDWLLKKLAAKGGVFGLQMGSEFHSQKAFDYATQHAGKPFWTSTATGRASPASIYDIDPMIARQFPLKPANLPEELHISVEDWVGVVDRVIQMVGEDHVSIGSDFDGGPPLPRGMRDIRDLPLLTEGMLRRGYSEERIRKVLGGNLLRVFRQITGK